MSQDQETSVPLEAKKGAQKGAKVHTTHDALLLALNVKPFLWSLLAYSFPVLPSMQGFNIYVTLRKATPFIQYRRPLGSGPSGNT